MDDEKILEKLKQQLQEEMQSLREQNIVQNKEKYPNSSLEELIRGKNILSEKEFIPYTKKVGISHGYIAKEQLTNHDFAVKSFYKNAKKGIRNISLLNLPISILQTYKYNEIKSVYADRRDGVQELLAAGIYKMLLLGQAPEEGLVIGEDGNKDFLYSRSKFLKNAETLSNFSGADTGKLDHTNIKLKEIKRFEKVIAACTMVGEADYHAGNLMVQQQDNMNENSELLLCKIDHGRSFMNFPKDFKSFVNSIKDKFIQYGYQAAIEAGHLTFNIEKFYEALKSMINSWDQNRVENTIDQVIDGLEKHDFDFKNFYLNYESWNDPGEKIDTVEEGKKRYKSLLAENINTVKQLSEEIEIITKFTNISEEFKNGLWVKEIAKSNKLDPILFARENNIKIDNQDAGVWGKKEMTLSYGNKQHLINDILKNQPQNKEARHVLVYQSQKKRRELINDILHK